MIIEKRSLDEPQVDAPPSYDTLVSGPSPIQYGDVKPPLPVASTSTPPILSTPSPTLPTKLSKPITAPGKSKGPMTWFSFGASRTAREVKATVLGLVRDLVRQQQPNPAAALGILDSCAEACTAYSISLSSVVQEKSIEGHTPLYWAIINREPEERLDESSQIPDLLTALLSYASPLSAATISEVRHACLLTSDQPLFQRLRLSPEFAPLSGTDEMILDSSIPPDNIVVENMPGDEGAFAVDFRIAQFQKRMQISKQIALEFIARGRMWQLKFLAEHSHRHHATGWCITLALLDHSPPTWIDSRLLIPDPASRSDPPSPSLIDAFNPDHRSKPTITLRLKSIGRLVPPNEHRRPQEEREIIVPLESSLMASSLQYAGTSYIAADGTLRARLEARLSKPEADCIIC